MRIHFPVVVVLLLLVSGPTLLHAQDPAPPPWTASASAGLAFTSGNSDTSSVNLGYEVAYDPRQRNLVKSEGLFLRSKSEGDVTADRLGLNGRDEFKLGARAFAFGQMQYLRDPFKDIAYLVSPNAGFGYRIADSDRTKLSVDAGAGVVWEKKPAGTTEHSGAITFGQRLEQHLSSTATATESLTGLYKTSDFEDALYTFRAGLAANVMAHTQVKVEVIDTYKNLVVAPIVKNDVALIVGVVFKR